MSGAVVATVSAEDHLRHAAVARASPKLHNAGHGVGAVQSAFRAAHKLQPIHASQRGHAKIKSSAGVVHRNAIHDHFVVARVATAHEQGSDSAALAAGRHNGARQEAQRLTRRSGLLADELIGGEHRLREARLFQWHWRSRSGDHHLLRRRGEGQLDHHVLFAGGGSPHRRRKSGRQYFHAKLSLRDVFELGFTRRSRALCGDNAAAAQKSDLRACDRARIRIDHRNFDFCAPSVKSRSNKNQNTENSGNERTRKVGKHGASPLHAKGLMERISAGLLACESDRGQPSRGAGHSGRPKNCGSFQLPTRLQLRGSAGFSPASLSSSAR